MKGIGKISMENKLLFFFSDIINNINDRIIRLFGK